MARRGQFAANPQSWNLSSYTRNNPLSNVDVDGFEVRKAELAAAQKQIASLQSGDRYTIAFMGITTDGKNYLQGKNRTVVPLYSNNLGLGELNDSNRAILSNRNGYINAMAGHSDIDQIDTANAIYGEAKNAGLTVDVLTHSNGIEGAGAFAPGKHLNTSVVVAPNTRPTQTMQNAVNSSARTSIVVSPRDFALNIPGAANKSPRFWAKLFKGNKQVTGTQTNQRGHRLRPYRQELEPGGSAQDITQP